MTRHSFFALLFAYLTMITARWTNLARRNSILGLILTFPKFSFDFWISLRRNKRFFRALGSRHIQRALLAVVSTRRIATIRGLLLAIDRCASTILHLVRAAVHIPHMEWLEVNNLIFVFILGLSYLIACSSLFMPALIIDSDGRQGW